MASRQAHKLTGWAAGAAAAVWVIDQGAGGPYHLLALATLLAGYLGGTAPDWLEQVPFRNNRRWCAHRTVTHWVPAWVFGFYWSCNQLGQAWWWAPLLGFMAGGLLHLACDWPNPLGVPILWSRHSLHLWKSGKADSVVVTVCWLATMWFADSQLFDAIHFRKAFSFLASAFES